MKVIEEKEQLINQLSEIRAELLSATIDYRKVQNGLWLNTDFAEAIGRSRPTVDEKKAYISEHSLTQKLVKEELYNKVQYLLLKIELCNDKLRCCDE